MIRNNKQIREYYKRHVKDGNWNPLWGGENRYDPFRIAASVSIQKHFESRVSAYTKPGDRALEVGCGSGGFLPFLGKLHNRVVGFDVSEDLVGWGREVTAKLALENVDLFVGDGNNIPFKEASFDVVVMVDVVHHLYAPKKAIEEIFRVLTKNGRVIIFEPNILNPILFFGALSDPHDWGLLRFWRKGLYKKLFQEEFDIIAMEYDPLVIGPDSVLIEHIAEKIFNWLLPKIFIVLEKRG